MPKLKEKERKKGSKKERKKERKKKGVRCRQCRVKCWAKSLYKETNLTVIEL